MNAIKRKIGKLLVIVLAWLSTKTSGQIQCPDGLIYICSAASDSILAFDIGLTLTSPVTPTPIIPLPANYGFGLALMANISGGTLSPTFYCNQNNSSIVWWDGTTWINSGFIASGNPIGLAGCGNALYAFDETPGNPTQIVKFTNPGPAVPLFTVGPDYFSEIVTDCSCNFYLLSHDPTVLYKYDPNGTLLASYPVTSNLAGLVVNEAFAIINNSLVTAYSNGLTKIGPLTPAGVTLVTQPNMQLMDFATFDWASCYSSSPPVAATINSAVIGCNPGTATLVASTTVSPLVYSWSGPGLVSPVGNGPSVTVNAAGIYTCIITEGFCSDILATLVTTVTSNSSAVNPVITPSDNICLEAFTQLFSSLSTSQYANQWSSPAAPNSGNTPTLNLAAPGIYTLQVTDLTNGCMGSATASVMSLPLLNLSLSSATMCVYSKLGNTMVTLSYSGAVNYTLVTSQGFSTSLVASQPVVLYQLQPFNNLGSAGTATLYGSNGACTGSVSASFMVLPLTTITAVPGFTTVCNGSAVTLQASGALQYDWLPPDHLIRAGDSNVTAQVNGAIVYSVTGTDKYGCNSPPVTLSVDVYPLHQGTLRANEARHCVPFCTDLTFTSASGTGNPLSSEWLIDGRKYVGNKFNHCFLSAGTHTVQALLTDSLHGCTNARQFFIEAYPKPQADFKYSPEKPVEALDEVYFTDATSGENLVQWNWYFGDPPGSRTANRQVTHSFENAGNYPVALVVRNSRGCADTIVKAIEVLTDFAVYVPNVFTPNEDDRNELFFPVVRGVRMYELKIYDRWGEQLFKSNDPQQGWDGSYKGQPCKSDIYTWTLDLTSQLGERKQLTGRVMIER